MTKSEKRQHDILRYIFSHVSDSGYPPTVREICNAVGLSSTSTVHWTGWRRSCAAADD